MEDANITVINNIPPFFYKTLGFCALIATCAFSWSAIRSSEVSLEIANNKLVLGNSIVATKQQLEYAQQQLQSQKWLITQLEQGLIDSSKNASSDRDKNNKIQLAKHLEQKKKELEPIEEKLADTSDKLDKTLADSIVSN